MPTPLRAASHARAGFALFACILAGGAYIAGSNTADATAIRAASPSAVAVVDLAQLLEGLEERTYLESELNSEIESRQKELDTIVGEIQRMQEDIEMIPADYKSGRRIQKIRDLRIKEVEARALRQFVQEQLSLEKGQMLATLYNKIQKAAAEIVTRDGWDIILIDDSGLDLPQMAQEQQMMQLVLSRRVLGHSGRVDVTQDVRTLMNNQFNAARP